MSITVVIESDAKKDTAIKEDMIQLSFSWFTKNCTDFNEEEYGVINNIREERRDAP